MRFSIDEIVSAVSGKLLFKKKDTDVDGVFTDSREKKENALFIPLAGENFDGHDYISAAVSNGAAGYLTQKETDADADFAILVKDTRLALGDLARYAMTKTKAKVIAVTGSVGKTTTRQFIASLTAQLGKTLVTIKNFNNDIGLPLTVLSMDGDEDYIVLELGMSALGEISYLSKIVKPDIGVITMIGTSHIEKLGTRENILKAKLEILDGMSDDGILFINGDDELLAPLHGKLKVKTELFGFNNGKYPLKIISCENGGEFIYDGDMYKISTSGKHNIINAACAISVAKCLGANRLQIQAGLDSFKNVGLRQELYHIGGKDIILDCYNASLDSFKASLAVLSGRNSRRKIAVLGGIGELGDYTEEILVKVGEEAYLNYTDLLIVCDENCEYIKNGAIKAGMKEKNILVYPKKEELIKDINSLLQDGDCVLIKASRKYKFEDIFNAIK